MICVETLFKTVFLENLFFIVHEAMFRFKLND